MVCGVFRSRITVASPVPARVLPLLMKSPPAMSVPVVAMVSTAPPLSVTARACWGVLMVG